MYRTVALCGSMLLMVAGDPSQAEVFYGDEVSRAHGVATIELVDRQPNKMHLELFSADGLWVGSLEVTKSGELGTTLDYHGPTAQLTIIWNPLIGVITLRDAPGHTAVIAFDLQQRLWQRAAEDQKFIAMYSRVAERALAVLGDIESRGHSGGSGKALGEAVNSARDVSPASDCIPGDWESACCWGTRRSMCCRCAMMEVGEECTNQYCWGCCEVLPCDSACGIGDFGCMCCVSGLFCAGNTGP